MFVAFAPEAAVAFAVLGLLDWAILMAISLHLAMMADQTEMAAASHASEMGVHDEPLDRPPT